MKEKDIDLLLKKEYKNWFKEIQEKATDMINNNYSNPYYTCVPKNWCSSDIRIQIVGEEGFGNWARGKNTTSADEINKIQTFCWSSLSSYLNYNKDYELYPNAEKYEYKNSPFWQRAQKLSKYGICTWSNQDLIHIRSDKNCALSKEDRKRLHSIDTKILSKEIEILKPTHVVLFGWHGISIQQELPELFQELYPKGLNDSHVWKNNVVHREIKGIHYIAAYHPGWRNKPETYEDKVIKVFEETI